MSETINATKPLSVDDLGITHTIDGIYGKPAKATVFQDLHSTIFFHKGENSATAVEFFTHSDGPASFDGQYGPNHPKQYFEELTPSFLYLQNTKVARLTNYPSAYPDSSILSDGQLKDPEGRLNKTTILAQLPHSLQRRAHFIIEKLKNNTTANETSHLTPSSPLFRYRLFMQMADSLDFCEAIVDKAITSLLENEGTTLDLDPTHCPTGIYTDGNKLWLELSKATELDMRARNPWRLKCSRRLTRDPFTGVVSPTPNHSGLYFTSEAKPGLVYVQQVNDKGIATTRECWDLRKSLLSDTEYSFEDHSVTVSLENPGEDDIADIVYKLQGILERESTDLALSESKDALEKHMEENVDPVLREAVDVFERLLDAAISMSYKSAFDESGNRLQKFSGVSQQAEPRSTYGEGEATNQVFGGVPSTKDTSLGENGYDEGTRHTDEKSSISLSSEAALRQGVRASLRATGRYHASDAGRSKSGDTLQGQLAALNLENKEAE